jgi:acyl-coenzyme A synthetase/AMP-(fatty) acid ligase
MNPADQFETIALSSPHLTAIVSETSAMSYGRLNEIVWSCVSLLLNENITTGMTIGIVTQSQLSNLIISLAAFRLGVSQFTLSNIMSKKARSDMITLTKANAIVSDIPKIETGEIKLVDFTMAKINQLSAPANHTQKSNDHRTYFYLQGSGTTATARVIRYTTDEFSQSMNRDLIVRAIAPHERHYTFTSLNFLTAKRRSLAVLSVGGTIVLIEGVMGFLETCQLYAVDHLSVVAVNFRNILANIDTDNGSPQLPRLKSLWIGGSPVSNGLRKKLRKHITDNVYVTYGCNEIGEVTVASPDIQDLHPDSIGKVLPGIELEIVNNAGEKLSAEKTGLIRFRGKGMYEAYVGELNSSSNSPTTPSWFYPKDFGLMTNDGTLVFKGRADDLMIYNGINIYPREIETILEAHPAIAEVAALPLTYEFSGQIPIAVVSLKTKINEAELMDFCAKELGIKAPKKIIIFGKLPRNAAGKIKKKAIANLIKRKLKIQ